MVTETEQETVIEGLPTAPPEPETGTIVPEAGDGETEAAPEADAASEADAPAQSWAERKAEIEANEEYKAAYEEEKASEYLRGAESERQRIPEYQSWLASQKQVENQFRAAAQVIPSLIEALRDGDPDLVNATVGRNPGVVKAIQTYADYLNGAAVGSYFQAQGQALANVGIGRLDERGQYQIDPAKLPDEIAWKEYRQARSIADYTAKHGSPGILKEFDAAIEANQPLGVALQKALDAYGDAHFQRGKKERGAANGEKAKAEARSGNSPDLAQKGAGSSSLTYAQILKMTPKQIEALPDGALQAAIDKA